MLNQTDPARAKFNADVSEALTKIYTDLIFFELELNQIDDATIEAAAKHKEVKRYKPWLDDLRKEKPHQLDEKIETLFTEKSQTGRGAWTRLFNETMSALKFDVKGEKGGPLSLEPTLNFLSDPDEKKRKAAAEALSKVFKANLPLFTLITNTLAKDKEISDRWRNFKDVADSRNLANRVEAPVVDALVIKRAGRISAAVAPLLRDEGQVARQEEACPLGPQRAASRQAGAHHQLGRG